MPGIESCLRAWTRQRDGLKRPSPIAAPGMLTIESFKNQRIRGPAPKAQREGVAVMGYRLSAIGPCSSRPSIPDSRLTTSCLNAANPSSSRATWAGSFNQRETPEGCGRARSRKACPARSAGRRLPTRSTRGNPRAVGSRRSAASRPNETTISGRTSAISQSRCRAQSAISLADGGRSPFPPRPVAGPGKHLVRLVR